MAGVNPLSRPPHANAMSNLSRAYNIHDLRELARKRLPKGLFEFVDRGAEDEVSLRGNRAALDRIRFRPRRRAPMPFATTVAPESNTS